MKIGFHEYIQAQTGEKGRPLADSRMPGPVGKCGGSSRVARKNSAFCNYQGKDWIRGELSMDSKSREKFWQGAGYMHGLKIFSHRPQGVK